jgi:ferrochelatase
VLVVNLGTPDAPTTSAVRRYLREFLSDPRVLDINAVGRWMLVNLIIAPFRSPKSAEAYQQVWLPEGSPLVVYGDALTAQLQARFPDVPILLAMRYQNPSIKAGMEALRAQGCDRVVIFPLFPQYASSSTGSALEEVYRVASENWNTPWIQVIAPYYDDAGFIEALTTIGRAHLDRQAPDHVLFSFHGLPERHCVKSDMSGQHCLKKPDCCEIIVDANRNCYRAQCVQTGRALAAALGLGEDDYTICFQSRLGRTPWIQPYTDELVTALGKKGVKSIAVFCPAFTADCLETIEEIGMRALEDFEKAGGETLELVPSLNAHPAWVNAAANLIEPHL